jgi:hypothetical protein
VLVQMVEVLVDLVFHTALMVEMVLLVLMAQAAVAEVLQMEQHLALVAQEPV